MRYLVVGSEGPGFASPEEAVEVLEEAVLPSFDALEKLEKKKKILAGGLPVGAREVVFIVEASSNEEVDNMLRDLPIWPEMEWEVAALQTFHGRASRERDEIKRLRKSLKKP